jgi:hypothetical protein
MERSGGLAMRRSLLRVATAVAGAAALGLTFAGTAHADHLGNGDDSAYSSNGSSNEGSDEAVDEDSDSEDTADEDSTDEDSADSADSADEDSADDDSADGDGDAPPKKRSPKEGLYGLDEDPGTMIHKNLDGETESPGFHHDGIGTVEVPRVATHS